jgi:DNA repair protein RecO (recombination protein O)
VALIESEALVVRTVEVGESDVIATLVTEQIGKISAVVRGARKGSRRVGGALEPVHTIGVMLDDKGTEVATLKEARIVRMRGNVVSDLDALDAAGVALRWARHLFPARHREPQGWAVLTALLDVLDARPAGAAGGAWSRKHLAQTGFAMLAAVGYGMDLARCVACSRPCPEGKPAFIDPARGGLVCRACGGAAQLMPAAVRVAANALAGGRIDEVTDAHAKALLTVVDRAMAAHAGFER